MVAQAIEAALSAIPADMLRRSGSVFYTGRSAFDGPSDLYVLGLNPGGSPVSQAEETIERDLAEWRDAAHERWSAYLDESWAGRPEGTYGMQPRLAHMIRQLGRDLRSTPAANVVFVRSPTEAALEGEKAALLRACWPVHEAVLGSLGVRVVLALGTTAGRWAREALGAREPVGSFREGNARGWTSEAHRAPDGRAVVTVTHPGRADWRNPLADPTPLVRQVLEAATAA